MATHEASRDPHKDLGNLEASELPDIVPNIDSWEADLREYRKETFNKVCNRLSQLGIEPNSQHMFSFPTEDGEYSVLGIGAVIYKNGDENNQIQGQRIVVNQTKKEFDDRRVIDAHDYVICFESQSLMYLHSRIEQAADGTRMKSTDGPQIIYKAGEADIYRCEKYKDRFSEAVLSSSNTAGMNRLLDHLSPLAEWYRDEIY